MHGSKRMVEPTMNSTGINIVRHSHLRNPTQSLEIRMLHQLPNQIVRYGDETMNGVIEDLIFAQNYFFGVKIDTN